MNNQTLKRVFPWLAFGIGLTISLILFSANSDAVTDRFKLPLLTALLMSEFGFLVTAFAAISMLLELFKKHFEKRYIFLLPANLILAIYLLLAGLKFWPGITGAG